MINYKNSNKDYNYKDFGIIGEPYFDVNFSDLFYLKFFKNYKRYKCTKAHIF